MLTNSVLISVILMSVLCLLKFNILLAILISALVGGLVAGMPLVGDGNIIGILIGGMGGNAETALSYVLLGTLAFAIQQSGLATMLSRKLEKVFGKSGPVLLFVIAGIACLSQNVIPIHIAFIPILIPPLLSMMNHMKIDRRGAACALTFGLKAPYIALPTGFGWIFHGIISSSMADNGMEIAQGDVFKYLWIPAIGMVVGLVVAILFSYRKPRDYEDISVMGEVEEGASDKFELRHIGALLGALATFGVQLATGSLPMGAISGLVIMLCFGTIPFKKMDSTFLEGIKMMGLISFVMMVAAGYGSVLRESGGVEQIVEASARAFGNSRPVSAAVMLLLGLIITMGIGTSFGTIPIVATIYVPLALALGFSIPATVILIGTAAALGDAGSPASDSTLGPTAGLNADGQHDHIWDTCVPTFLHYNIPLLVFGFIGALMV